jgi:outer membrane protein assembly factor BamA
MKTNLLQKVSSCRPTPLNQVIGFKMKNKFIFIICLFVLILTPLALRAQEISQKFLSLNLKEIVITGNLSGAEMNQIQSLSWQTRLGQKPSLQNIQADMAQIYSLGFIKRIEMQALDIAKGGQLVFKIEVHPEIKKIDFENSESLSPEVFYKKMKLLYFVICIIINIKYLLCHI